MDGAISKDQTYFAHVLSIPVLLLVMQLTSADALSCLTHKM